MKCCIKKHACLFEMMVILFSGVYKHEYSGIYFRRRPLICECVSPPASLSGVIDIMLEETLLDFPTKVTD